jgi:hypothetical protein
LAYINHNSPHAQPLASTTTHRSTTLGLYQPQLTARTTLGLNHNSPHAQPLAYINHNSPQHNPQPQLTAAQPSTTTHRSTTLGLYQLQVHDLNHNSPHAQPLAYINCRYTMARTETSVTVRTEHVELMIAVPVSVYSLGCGRLNVTLLSETSSALSGVVLCPGVAKSRVPTDPAHPGTVMDSWTDIVLGDSLNLNGSVDTTDCYCGAGEHSSAAMRARECRARALAGV